MPIIPIIIVGTIILLVMFFIMTYKVVKPNEAHIVVFMGRGRKVYSPARKEGAKARTSYFYIPLLMQRYILPLTNVKFDIANISLKDQLVAPFICDVIAWVNIDDPIVAAERLDISAENPFQSLYDDLNNIVQAVAREVAMKQEILDIMRDRKSFSSFVSTSVNGVLQDWGVNLTNLEVNDIRDEENSNVISDYESIRKSQVSSISRKEVALREREAIEAEQHNFKIQEVAKAEAIEVAERRKILARQNIGLSEQEKERTVSEAEMIANRVEVAAKRETDVGIAEVERDATIEQANGEAMAHLIRGEKQAQVVRLKGTADADITQLQGEADGAAILAQGLADAESKDKMAEAMAKYNEAATSIEKIRAWMEVEKVKYEALGNALSKADLKLVSSGEGASVFGFPLNAETGADIGQMIEAVGGLEKVKGLLGKFKKDGNNA